MLASPLFFTTPFSRLHMPNKIEKLRSFSSSIFLIKQSKIMIFFCNIRFLYRVLIFYNGPKMVYGC